MARLVCCLVLTIGLFAAAPGDEARQKERLSAFQPLVGSWRGVGQPERGSTKNSWVEEANWSWSFEPGGPALVAKLPKAKLFSELRLASGDAEKTFTLLVTPTAG